MMPAPEARPRSVVLVGNPHSGERKHGRQQAQEALVREGLDVRDTIHIHDLDRLHQWIERPPDERPRIVAAGGDGTVGAVAGYVIKTGVPVGILPLGTHNDVARSLGIPLSIEEAVRLLTTGTITTIDGGMFVGQDEVPRYFVQAAAIGIEVVFAKRAAAASLRRRLGRLTYIVAAALALRTAQPVTRTLGIDGRQTALCLLHLTVINAPVCGGLFDLRLPGSRSDDRRLDVLAIDAMPWWRLLVAPPVGCPAVPIA